MRIRVYEYGRVVGIIIAFYERSSDAIAINWQSGVER
ncbi:hypothetical protein PSBY109024_01265 [Pseudoalteromonas byunsanensis]